MVPFLHLEVKARTSFIHSALHDVSDNFDPPCICYTCLHEPNRHYYISNSVDEAAAATLVSLPDRRSDDDVNPPALPARKPKSDGREDSESADDEDYYNMDYGTMVVKSSEDEGCADDSNFNTLASMVIHDTLVDDKHEGTQVEQQMAINMLDSVLPESTLTRKASAAGRMPFGPPEPVAGQAAPANANNNPRVPVVPLVQRPFAPFSRALHQSGLLPGAGGAGVCNPGGVGTGGQVPHGSLNHLSYQEMQLLLNTLNSDLETELRALTVRYRHKRQPLLDAIADKTTAYTGAEAQAATASSVI